MGIINKSSKIIVFCVITTFISIFSRAIGIILIMMKTDIQYYSYASMIVVFSCGSFFYLLTINEL